MGKLTAKEQLFVSEYIKCWNGAEAARRAGYSKNTARSIASENLTKPDIRALIDEKLKQSAMSADEVLARLTAHASADMSAFMQVNKDGFASLNFSSDEAKGNLHLIKKIKSKRTRRMVGRGKNAEPWEDESVEIELYDSQAALRDLGRYHNLFTEKDEDGKPLTDEQRIARAVAILDAARARRDGQTPA